MAPRCKVCWLHPRLRLWVENELLLSDISLREASQQLKKHNIPISHVSLNRHKQDGHMAPADLTPVEKIDYYTDQLSPQLAKLRKHQLIQTVITQWHQLQKWHTTRGEKDQAEADEEQIQQLQNKLTPN
jgi:hypothetical protein